MPPKRAAKRAAASGPSATKKSRPSPEGSDNDGVATAAIPRSKRWAAVSGSANIDAGYRRDMKNPSEAYTYVCVCQPPFSTDDEDEDEDEDEDDEWEDATDDDEDDDGGDDGNDNGDHDGDHDDKDHDDKDHDGDENKEPKRDVRTRCDGGKTCLCDKPASEHPGHLWKLTAAGKRKFISQFIHFELRCPDNFGMYTFNDHAGYGVLEMLQNLILDFEEAAGNTKEQWAVCEGLAFFLQTSLADVVTGIDDGDTVDATYQLLGRLFMSMLAQLEREGLLAKDSEIKNLGLVMAFFMDFARAARDYGLLEESEEEALGLAKDKKEWEPHAFENQILAYARKYDIDLVGPSDIGITITNANADVDLPVPGPNTGKADPFGFGKSLKKYKTNHGGITAFLAQSKSAKTPIGGDSLDVTTWSSAKRKSKAFDKKDPLGKHEIDAIKKGYVLSLG